MKVIFLDFDGVLNCQTWYEARLHERLELDPERVAQIDKICRVGAGVVVSSSWRILGLRGLREPLQYDEQQLDLPSRERLMVAYCRGVLDGYRFRGQVVGATPTYSPHGAERGWQIQAWLESHPEVTSFVILDDSCDMVHLSSRLVRTSGLTGITSDDVQRAIAILDAPWVRPT